MTRATNRPNWTTTTAAYVALVAVFSLAAATACGVSTEDTAQAVEPPAFWEAATTSTTAPPDDNDLFTLSLYWIASAEAGPLLIRVDRPREAAPTIVDALDALVEGPSEDTEEALPTIRTFLSAQLAPQVEADPTEGLLVVRVADEAGIREEARTELFQQLVCTLTEPSLTNGAVDRIQVVDSQGNIPLTNYNLELLEQGGTRADYGDCVPTTDLDEALSGTTSSTTS